MSVINTNTKSIVAQNALTVNNRAMSKAMEQLSTGKRINSAADDAAGLAISSKMTSQIRGLNQAVRNANDGISMLQTAEGATIEITNMLQRMRELAVQSANDTNTGTDREYLDLEYQQLTKEIDRIASSTEWNGMNILNNTEVGTSTAVGAGTARSVMFQVGANASQTISVNLKDFSFSTGVPATAGLSQINMLANDHSGDDTFTFDFTRPGANPTTTSFSVAITAPTGALATDAEVEVIAGEIQDAITNTVGFQNVTVTAVGTSITIEDGEGGNIDLGTFDALASGASNTPNEPVSQVTVGSAAGAAAQPSNVASVFSGNARINNTTIANQQDANTAIQSLDEALKAVNEERATLGSVINRLTYAADNLMNVSQNTSASRSQVMDTDYAQATTELARTQIISQAATAMLAQANQAPQSVLSLLR
jgi:flagellin